MIHMESFPEPSEDETKERLQSALHMFGVQDSYLLSNDLHERTITHKLAEYLQPLFPNWNVDCEYNRDGHDPKRVHLPDRQPVDAGAGSNVYPDIIVHERGSNDHNILIIEAKKSGEEDAAVDKFDRQKVEAFINDLQYRYGTLVVFHIPPLASPFHARFRANGEWKDLGA